MLAVARRKAGRGVGFRRGRAEELPFKDGWFERAVMRLSVHLVDRPRAFAEVRRVLAAGGRLAIETFDPVHFDTYWLNDYFPSIREIDRARFPTEEGLRVELAAAGFDGVRVTRLRVERTWLREEALARVRGRHISTFQLLGDDEYRRGLERAERELPDRIESASDVLVVVGTSSGA
jgi:SAM-dependent methyltransferase